MHEQGIKSESARVIPFSSSPGSILNYLNVDDTRKEKQISKSTAAISRIEPFGYKFGFEYVFEYGLFLYLHCENKDNDIVREKEVSCNLYVINHLDRGDLSILSPIYTSMGLIPSIEIFNRTSLMSFKFEKTLVQDMAAWHLEIPREKIITATDVFPGDEWHVKLKVHYGSRLFLTEGTLLDVVREPLLQWRIGVEVGASEVLPVLQVAHTLLAASRLCASDVGIIAPLLSSHEMPNTGNENLIFKCYKSMVTQ
ncbi:cation channel sperm-associated auxiliary subunit beta-like [Scyliorhinus torazame]|uniref:cation channel sperm-associated auxiliary subunit beta-like n=1 Tax=Scyliorhinus torazame TaxID=75743 RepID=UPI003B593B2C